MPLILSGNVASAVAGAYSVANSCRFNDGDSPHMDKDQGTPTSQQKFTYSGWIKKCTNGAGDEQHIFSAGAASDSYYNGYRFKTDDTLHINFDSTNPGTTFELVTSRVFRDPSAWYHIVVAVDTTQGTAANRLKLYVNGVQETSFGTAAYPDQNRNLGFMASGDKLVIGRQASGGSEYFDGYMAEVVFIDGTQYAASDFGEFDSDSPTIWKPKDVTGLTFGTNGFYLDFEASDNLGNDANGGTDLGETNIAATDQSIDTPTNNFATLNPLYKQDHTFSEGNLEYTSAASDWDSGLSTIGVASGKWYVETKVTAIASGVTRTMIGLTDVRNENECAEDKFITSFDNGDTVGQYNDSVTKNGSDAGGSWETYTTNDIIGMYVDLDNGKVYFSKNGTMQNSGDPTSGSTGTGAIAIATGQTYLFGATAYGGGASQTNFGSPVFSITSGNADPNGYGSFEYGTQNYYALCTKNLAEFG